VAALTAAEAWVKTLVARLRTERFAPIAAQVTENWALLRRQSNVSLGEIRLEGSTTRRRLELGVTVDGAPGAALGVMSQGELCSLALSLFLPRATMESSPFRFVVVDDPVQSMDPAKVDGLAQVLHRVSTTRQVVVFTHDARLREALSRLRIPARVMEVSRRPGSVIEVRQVQDSVSQRFSDARAVAKNEEMPLEIRQAAVPSLCRAGIEGACTIVVRRRRIGRGDPHDAVDRALAEATTLRQKLALAMFDDVDRAGQTFTSARSRWGQEAATTLGLCTTGSHEGTTWDPADLVRDAVKLAQAIVRLS
jgi:hypothetical protein